ncbi:hypothetical protein EW145_g1588 [Phellinidium pouzarii]|uniref:Cytochrome b5 heme-binding domain-containing protein n=1 Tax=Phellinidium pouzarii TaxID=167371 RepID=A0A4S4LFP0_9AGAM|nr:hypothetical protein EW145_g1588 [Phellinidium pouzarii]
MSAYIRGWLLGTPLASTATVPEQPKVSLNITAPDAEETHEAGDHDSDVDTDATDTDTDTDTPPAFPALNSAQRLGSTSKPQQSPATSIPKFLKDAQLMPPPTAPCECVALIPPPSASSTLGLPPTTNKLPTKKFREKVALAPGFGPLDWAALKESGADLRGVDTLLRVTPSMLKQHNKKDDAWSAFNGKVYNITPYLPFHPGGEKEIMRAAGRDGTKLFALTHAWVNVEFMLDACLVGFLVSESYGS